MTHSPQPAAPANPAHPSTAEIPVVPPSGDAAAEQSTQVFGAPPPPPTLQAPVVSLPRPLTSDDDAQSSSPVDFVPGFTGVGATAPPPASRRRFSYGPRARAAVAGISLVALSVLLLQLGLGLGFGTESFWSVVPLWSLFASLAAVLGLLAFVPDAPGRSRLRPQSGWKVAAGGLAGLAVFWLLVVLPVADTDRGFLLAAALAALAAALWIAPSRQD